MIKEVEQVVNSLPKKLQADLKRYSNWLEIYFEVIGGKLPKEKRRKLDRNTFICLAIYREIISVLTRQDRIIRKTFSYLDNYDIRSIQLRGETLLKDSDATRSLVNLIETLKNTLKRNRVAFVSEAKDLVELAFEIASRGFILE